MKNKSGNDKIGTVFIQDNLVHPDAQRVTIRIWKYGYVLRYGIGANKKTCPLFSQTKDRIKYFYQNLEQANWFAIFAQNVNII